jgi:hypothetical protein
LNAIKAADVDYVLKIEEIPQKLIELVHEVSQPDSGYVDVAARQRRGNRRHRLNLT